MTPPPSPPRYDRAATISAIRNFYTFLTRLPRLDATQIVDAPPERGRPELTDAFLAPLGKNAAVNELIRHLPYIAAAGETGDDQIAPEETLALRYDGAAVRWSLERGVVEGTVAPVGAGRVPPHVAVLTQAARYGSWLLLDTEEGTITDYIQFERPERPTPGADSPDHWRAYRTLPVAEFFEEWKDKYLRAEWVVLPEVADDVVMYRFDAETDEVRRIYREHGWPDAFRRDECRRALIAWCDTRGMT